MTKHELKKFLHMEDDELLSYAEIHSNTPRALFSREHVVRIFQMAGLDPPTGLPDFVRFSKPEVVPVLTKAAKERRKLRTVAEIMNS